MQTPGAAFNPSGRFSPPVPLEANGFTRFVPHRTCSPYFITAANHAGHLYLYAGPVPVPQRKPKKRARQRSRGPRPPPSPLLSNNPRPSSNLPVKAMPRLTKMAASRLIAAAAAILLCTAPLSAAYTCPKYNDTAADLSTSASLPPEIQAYMKMVPGGQNVEKANQVSQSKKAVWAVKVSEGWQSVNYRGPAFNLIYGSQACRIAAHLALAT